MKRLSALVPAALAAAGLFLFAGAPSSAEIASRAGTTSGQFLRLDMGARHAAMGGTYAAFGDDATTLWGQPAAMAEFDRTAISLQHSSLFQGISQEYLGVGLPLGSHRVGLTVNLLNVDDILRTTEDAAGNLASSGGFFEARDLGVAVHYGRRLGDRLSAGGAVRYITSKIDNVSASGVGVDIGARYRTPIEGLTIGASVTNLGQGLKFIRRRDDLPTTGRVGLAYAPQTGPAWLRRSLLSADLWKGPDTEWEGGVGVEFAPVDLLRLRAGYRSAGDDVGEGLAAGFGVRWNNLELDYAYVPFGELGDAHRVSGTVRWGGGGSDEPAARRTGDAPGQETLAPKTRGARK